MLFLEITAHFRRVIICSTIICNLYLILPLSHSSIITGRANIIVATDKFGERPTIGIRYRLIRNRTLNFIGQCLHIFRRIQNVILIQRIKSNVWHSFAIFLVYKISKTLQLQNIFHPLCLRLISIRDNRTRTRSL